jgi:putative transposase
MSRPGECWDHAVVKIFVGSMKQERFQWRHYQTRYEAQQDILQYIARFITDIGSIQHWGISPNNFEQQFVAIKKLLN